MKLLNLGCGSKFHPDWVNVDFVKTGEKVIAFNLSKGIPFPDSSFDVIYHSHVLEHFSRDEGAKFIDECYRVLKRGGIIRIAVPDLEMIAKEYLKNLNRATSNEPLAKFDYEWIMLEMLDQTVRNSIGGNMVKYLQRMEIPNKEYIYSRIGDEGKKINETYLNSINHSMEKQKNKFIVTVKAQIKKVFKLVKYKKKKSSAKEIGRFRLSGEIHQWMYDRYSLSCLLIDSGFKNINIVNAFESQIPDWNNYELDSCDGIVRKPDSLFIEAIK